MFRWYSFILVSLAVLQSGCGYSWQGKYNPWKEKGINSVFIDVVNNNTLRAGVEVPFSTALIKEFSRGNRIKVVQDRKQADAIVQATLDTIETRVLSGTRVSQTALDDPDAAALDDFVVASEYTVSANMTVSLVKDGKALWSQSFARSKVYPASNRFGLQGTTSVLINYSQEQLALADIARFLASDTYDAMFEAF